MGLKVSAALVLTGCFAFLRAEPTPATALLVLAKSDHTLAIVNPSTLHVVATVPSGPDPHEVIASDDGRFAYISNYGGGAYNTLTPVDLVQQKALPVIDLGPLRGPHGLFYAGEKVWFTAEAAKAIGSYDPNTHAVDWILGTGQNGTHMVLFSKDANQIFTANIGSDSITAIDRVPGPLGWSETVIPVGKGPEAIDLSPDGHELWTAHSRDGGVSIIDVAAKKVVQTFDVQTKRSNRLKFTPDGKLVLISDLEGGELVLLDRAERKQIKRIQLGRSPEGILIVPDGSRAYVGVAGENNVAVIDLKTLEVTGRISTGSGPDGMAWAERRF